MAPLAIVFNAVHKKLGGTDMEMAARPRWLYCDGWLINVHLTA
jgi:hypothetical protein